MRSGGEAVEADGDGVLVRVRVQPRSSRVGLERSGDGWKLRVAAPPVDDAANRAVIEEMARVFGCSKGRVTIHRGRGSRDKVLRVAGIGVAEVRAGLEAAVT